MGDEWWLAELEIAEFGPNHPLWPSFVEEAESLALEDDDLEWTLPLPGRHQSLFGSVRLRAFVRGPSEASAISHLDRVIRQAGAAADASGTIYMTPTGPTWAGDHGHAEPY